MCSSSRPWAGIGFAGLRGYPHLLSTVARREGAESYSLAALVHLGVSNLGAAVALETAVGIGLLVLVFAAGRRGRDRDAFALALLAILAFSPLLEIHYLALLLVIVALYRERLSAAWIVPVAPLGSSGSQQRFGCAAGARLPRLRCGSRACDEPLETTSPDAALSAAGSGITCK